jgi:hypothetical protein
MEILLLQSAVKKESSLDIEHNDVLIDRASAVVTL